MARRIRRWRALWTEPARDELREVFRFIRHDNPTAAQKVIREMREKVGKLAQFPLSGREVPELTAASLREVIAGSYRIIYRLVGNTVEILTVIHSRRKIGE
ncbi:MAG TPA: type II toxin-antitoxin system RelE/ParE family toxin [Candidatus Binatia bacterium]|nr:type II toxin-antitoxin system RelE/ParE family toxin [Candidatus Binatia bacterium]